MLVEPKQLRRQERGDRLWACDRIPIQPPLTTIGSIERFSDMRYREFPTGQGFQLNISVPDLIEKCYIFYLLVL